MRKLLFLLLLLAGWAVIFLPFYSDDIFPPGGLFNTSHPSEKPLPPAWQNTERVQVRIPGAGIAGGFRPGSTIEIEVGSLPPNSPVRIGLGLSTPGYFVIAQAQTDAEGRVTTALTLPAAARPGDTAFIMVTTLGLPSIQRMSDYFMIIDE